MSTVQEITSTNYLFEDYEQFDSSWFEGINLNAEVTKANKIQSSFVLAVAEVVNYVAQAALLGLSCHYLGKDQVLFQVGLCGFFKLIQAGPFEKEDIEKFDNRKSYVQYFQAKAELVACLCIKDQAFWLVKECINSTIYKVIGAAIILKAPQHWIFNQNPALNLSLRISALFVTGSAISGLMKKVLDFVEAKTYSFVYHLVQNQHAELA